MHNVLILVLLFGFYTLFWIKFWPITKKPDTPQFIQYPKTNTQSVLAKAESVLPLSSNTVLPQNHLINIAPRKQKFNLSCEFAAAAAIIYNYTNDPVFASENEQEAEKILMKKVAVSQNPNVGIRMGVELPDTLEKLYKNLNYSFGGPDYYGVHAPPFIDLFADYNLMAKPIYKSDSVADDIRKAISMGHLVMAWIQIGQGKSIDAALSYGTTPIVKGEHVVVLYGFDHEGVFIMDPGSGGYRYLSFDKVLVASEKFNMPFLEVYPSSEKFVYEPTEIIDRNTGLDRKILKIRIENGSREGGKASILAQFLKEFGYVISEVATASNKEFVDTSIIIKKSMEDYIPLLRKDIELLPYRLSTISHDLSASDSADVVIVVGN